MGRAAPCVRGIRAGADRDGVATVGETRAPEVRRLDRAADSRVALVGREAAFSLSSKD
jgi:hypothetical protein